MSRNDEVVGVESSNDGTSDEESVNDKAQELLFLMQQMQQEISTMNYEILKK